jgi:hypothetical protein
VTQAQLGEAFSRERSTSVPLISSWESTTSPKTPPVNRLEQYARFFATPRSAEEGALRLLTLDELNAAERLAYEELLDQLTSLRPEQPGQRGAHLAAAQHSKGLWQFPDSYDIVIVCARLPRDLMHSMGSYTDPNSPDYVDLYTYADPDALIELFGHIRAVNSVSEVRFKAVDQLERDDYTAHLVLLGGVDWNRLTRELLERVDVPVEQITRPTTEEPSGFEVTDEHGTRMYSPIVRGGRLLEDVAHFYRGENPFNVARTVTICNGMYGRGTYGAVRALTDKKFQQRNDDYASTQLERHAAYSLLMRVAVVDGLVLTPDWTVADTRLHEWPGAST